MTAEEFYSQDTCYRALMLDVNMEAFKYQNYTKIKLELCLRTDSLDRISLVGSFLFSLGVLVTSKLYFV